ncbi:MAG: N2,N2-dimethylguanosine tRNA methyltransferase [Candidatus Thermoplasmatota archaeon]|nr:N2,N2-dimethylguanosine tRNA methyltransferase [Candidatus Thermoplasmatota archaeon]MCL5793527.1 N2,N2-dimethylguanosine tRNA methyltransferase [Candidatus Thermoplasmatota archaeon]
MIFTEGKVRIRAGLDQGGTGPGKKSPGFFNRSQETNRNITIAVLNTFLPQKVLDGFGGTGIRGIRIAKELGLGVTIAEPDERSLSIIKENAKLNDADVEIIHGRFEEIAASRRFDYVDIDPYGSPISFLYDGIKSVKNGGMLGITATDLTGLTGSSPSKTYRRYGARIICDNFKHETGVRLLISAVIRHAAAMDIAAVPVLSVWNSHYYRLFFRLRTGAALADRLISSISTVDKHEIVSPDLPSTREGPLWLGNLHQQDIAHMLKIPPWISIADRYLESFSSDNLEVFFIDSALEASWRKGDMPQINKIIKLLTESGIRCGRTQFSGTGIKTSDPGETRKTVQSLIPMHS